MRLYGWKGDNHEYYDHASRLGYYPGQKRLTRLKYDLQVHAARSIADVGFQGINAKTIVQCGSFMNMSVAIKLRLGRRQRTSLVNVVLMGPAKQGKLL